MFAVDSFLKIFMKMNNKKPTLNYFDTAYLSENI